MKIKDVIYQLESLIDNSKSFLNGEEDEIWRNDIVALEKAIEIIKDRVVRDEMETLGKTWISMDYHEQEINKYKHDKDKPRLDLVPPGIIEAVGIIRTYGVEKYGDNTNWEKVEKERYRAAMMRHLCEYLRDPTSCDDESGYNHLWPAI